MIHRPDDIPFEYCFKYATFSNLFFRTLSGEFQFVLCKPGSHQPEQHKIDALEEALRFHGDDFERFFIHRSVSAVRIWELLQSHSKNLAFTSPPEVRLGSPSVPPLPNWFCAESNNGQYFSFSCILAALMEGILWLRFASKLDTFRSRMEQLTLFDSLSKFWSSPGSEKDKALKEMKNNCVVIF